MISLGLIIFGYSTDMAVSWHNGPHSVGEYTGIKDNLVFEYARKLGINPFFLYEDTLKKPDPFERSRFFSTHDYIASFALDYLCKSDPLGKYYWLNDPNQRYLYIFLAATEAPDSFPFSPISLDSGQSTVGGKTALGPGFPDGTHNFDHLQISQKTKKRGMQAVDALVNHGWREAAAFYLGAMTHYIVDMSSPPHADLLPYYAAYHYWIEKQVGDNTLIGDYEDNGEIGDNLFLIDLEEYLGYTSDKLEILSVISMTPSVAYEDILYTIATFMAITTLYSIETNLDRTTEFETFPSDEFYNFYLTHESGFDFNTVNRSSVEYRPFFDRIEKLLNWAVYYSACAIKVCLDRWEDEDQDEENRATFPEDPEPLPRNSFFDTADFLARYGALLCVLLAAGVIGRKILR
jgi:hypothetical protein